MPLYTYNVKYNTKGLCLFYFTYWIPLVSLICPSVEVWVGPRYSTKFLKHPREISEQILFSRELGAKLVFWNNLFIAFLLFEVFMGFENSMNEIEVNRHSHVQDSKHAWPLYALCSRRRSVTGTHYIAFHAQWVRDTSCISSIKFLTNGLKVRHNQSPPGLLHVLVCVSLMTWDELCIRIKQMTAGWFLFFLFLFMWMLKMSNTQKEN